ncbi:purine-nucleoside phosphorylase [Thermoflavifilum aggregans]|uniref:Purine nucleoside phosphorylase n=1 Tax=Thermoflavifilum aggregans TaxID=454188 RepID=A0A2M9CSZ2_9BACT|nr:purine-nucleoside phosphorylase [Thermoflavifilum aggregans]PJJ75013.1 purine-nucleoside phosphorylase [Thermoflavifilum aggregans]
MSINWPTRIQQTLSFLRDQGIHQVDAAIILGSGLDETLRYVSVLREIPYTDIPYFPEATVSFHKGQLIWGQIGSRYVLVMQGRFHYYEGYSLHEITFPVRVMQKTGARWLIISNAAGGIRTDLRKGDLVLIEDHINLLPDNPLRGLHDPSFGERFPDMSRPYDLNFQQLLKKQAQQEGIVLKSGVYAAMMGPSLETRAEYRFLRTIGADMVGMSTVPEVIVANQVKLPCTAISVITDECDPDHLEPVSVETILEVAHQADKQLSRLIAQCIHQWDPLTS